MFNLSWKHLGNGTRNARNVGRNPFTKILVETNCCVLIERVQRRMKMSLSDNILLKATENKLSKHRICEKHGQKQWKSSCFYWAFGNGNISHFRYANHQLSLIGQPMLLELAFLHTLVIELRSKLVSVLRVCIIL